MMMMMMMMMMMKMISLISKRGLGHGGPLLEKINTLVIFYISFARFCWTIFWDIYLLNIAHLHCIPKF